MGKDEIAKLGLNMYRRGGVDALQNLLDSISLATEGLTSLGRDDVIDLIEHSIKATAHQ